MYFYHPRGVVIFEMTRMKLKRKEVAVTVCRGNLQSQELTKGTSDRRIIVYYMIVTHTPVLELKSVCLTRTIPSLGS